MRVTLNLASRPYVELRPLYRKLRFAILLLLVTGFAFWYVLRTEYVRAQAARAQVEAIQSQVSSLDSQRNRYESDMRQPQNAAVLDQARFLNNLFLRKAFSWTAVMIDLERVLPAGVQVLSIDPQVAKDGAVSVRLRVLGPHERSVELIRNLERSRRFLAPRLTAESADTSNTQGAGLNRQNAAVPSGRVNFDIIALYNPLPTPSAKALETEEKKDTPPPPVRHRHTSHAASAVSGGAR